MKVRIIVVCIMLSLLLVMCKNERKTAYVELITVYDRFDYTSELKSKLLDIQEVGTQMKEEAEKKLDSLYNLLEEALNNNEKAALLNAIDLFKVDYQRKENEFLQNYQLQVKKYDEQIWNRINVYITEYGQKNGYEYIFGADGSGGIMYADSTNNITTELTEYINNKYQDID